MTRSAIPDVASSATVCLYPVDDLPVLDPRGWRERVEEALRGGGTALLFAHTVRGKTTALDLSRICVDEKALMGSYSADFQLQRSVARLIFSRRFDVRPLITHRFPLEEVTAAIALASAPTPESLKIVVSPMPAVQK